MILQGQIKLVYDKLNMIHKYICGFFKMLGGIENKLLLSQSVMIIN